MAEPLRPGTGWRKSSASNITDCVEAGTDGPAVLLRTSRAPDGTVLRCAIPDWLTFVDAVRRGELDGLT